MSDTDKRLGHFPHPARPIKDSMVTRYRETLGLSDDEPVDRFDTPAYVGKGLKHARVAIHAAENPTKDERDVKHNIAVVDALTKGMPDYSNSPLFRSIKPKEEHRLFPSPEEIAKSRGFTIESKLEVNMNNEELKEEFLNELFGGYNDWVTLNLNDMHPSTNKKSSPYSPPPKGPIRGITDFSSTLTGLFGGSVKASSEKKKYATKEDSKASESGKTFVPKKEIDRASNSAQRIQHAGGFLSDRSLKDLDIPTFLRNAMERDIKGTASPEQKGALQQTGYRSQITGSTYGQVGKSPYKSRLADHTPRLDADTRAAIDTRRDVYSNKPYRAIRGESIEQTEARILAEVRQSVVSRNKKGGEFIDNPVEDVPASIPGFPVITNESVISFVNDLMEVDGAMGGYASGPTKPPKAVDPAEKIFNTYYNQGSTQIPFKSGEAERIKTSTEEPTLLRKAMTGDAKAQASIEAGEKSMEPKSTFHDAQHHMSSVELAKKGYMDFTGKR